MTGGLTFPYVTACEDAGRHIWTDTNLILSMPIELEIKLKVENHDPVRAALEEGGGRFVSSVVETNHILDNPSGGLRSRGEGLRVRVNRTLRGTHQLATLTYKGPRQASSMKRREEREMVIDDPDATQAILQSLGFLPVLNYEKQRESWALNDCRIELDSIERLGKFVEIEGPTEQAILAVRDQIQLTQAPAISKSYVRMVVEANRKK